MENIEKFLSVSEKVLPMNYEALGIKVVGRLDDNNGTYFEKGDKTFYITFCEDSDQMVYGEEDGEDTVTFDNTTDMNKYFDFMVRGLKFLGIGSE